VYLTVPVGSFCPATSSNMAITASCMNLSLPPSLEPVISRTKLSTYFAEEYVAVDVAPTLTVFIPQKPANLID